jgi:hypothetical protein
LSPFDPFISSLTQAQLHWIFLNYNADREEQFDQLKLIAYIIDPARAKAVFEPQPASEVSESSQDWFMEEIKRNSKLDPKEVEGLLKQGVGASEEDNLTRIEKV